MLYNVSLFYKIPENQTGETYRKKKSKRQKKIRRIKSKREDRRMASPSDKIQTGGPSNGAE